MWFGMIGVLLIITASINFVNLTIAQVMKRKKEVGIIKVLGSSRWQLSGQFIGEATLLLLVSSLLAIIVTELILPPIRPILNLPDSVRLASPFELILFLIAASTFIIALSTIYPARVMVWLQTCSGAQKQNIPSGSWRCFREKRSCSRTVCDRAGSRCRNACHDRTVEFLQANSIGI